MEHVEMAQLKALAYRFLATLYLDQPSPAWLAELARTGVLDEFPLPVTDGLDLIRAAAGRLAAGETDGREFRADYDQLFIGPGHLPAPPWESVYRTDEHLVFDWPTLEVRAAYRQMGLTVAKPSDPDDHIGLELLFLATLAEREAAGDTGAAEAGQQFLQEHLLQWAPAFCADVVAHAQTDLYRGLGLLTRAVLGYR
jgi:TorA maturation chaperone TorD